MPGDSDDARFRIIPARAGFTARRPDEPRQTQDHPRSRGVYSTPYPPTAPTPGSSPLARGLRRRRLPRPFGRRIIPARAGFTVLFLLGALFSWDHPRSRGVYLSQGATGTQAQGSSPLARGLRLEVHYDCPFGWIIPARAGFTIICLIGTFPYGDHPRSRGVYHAPSVRASDFAGSSPLARGLLTCTDPTGEWTGIIPARAGFTPRVCLFHHIPPDHPRSRGVYAGR